MTDKRIKMECPFCHTPANRIEIKQLTHCLKSNSYIISCPECGVNISKYGKQNTIDAWNRR